MKFAFDRVDMGALEKELSAIRRDLHSYPESAWTEFGTTVKIMEKLAEMGVKVSFGPAIHSRGHMYGMPPEKYIKSCESRAIKETGRADLVSAMSGGFTGCVAELDFEKPGPTVAFRVDIDCNEVAESADAAHLPAAGGFASKHAGLMHACGHDGHAAIGIGAIKLMLAYKDMLCGKVLVIFQPAEEGLRGARSMAESGILDSVDYIIGAHLGLRLQKTGAVAVGTHGFLASTKLDVSFRGRASHAGLSPEEGRNALAAAAAAALNLLAIPRHSAGSSRINIGTLNAGSGRNVIPEYAEMTLETRGITSEINEYMADKAQRVCRAAAEMYECEYNSRFMGAAGSGVCDAGLVESVAGFLGELQAVTEIIGDMDFGGGEDFTTMMTRVQSHGGKATEMIIGTPRKAAHHNGSFDFDEAALAIGAQIFAKIALGLCKRP